MPRGCRKGRRRPASHSSTGGDVAPQPKGSRTAAAAPRREGTVRLLLQGSDDVALLFHFSLKKCAFHRAQCACVQQGYSTKMSASVR